MHDEQALHWRHLPNEESIIGMVMPNESYRANRGHSRWDRWRLQVEHGEKQCLTLMVRLVDHICSRQSNKPLTICRQMINHKTSDNITETANTAFDNPLGGLASPPDTEAAWHS